MENFCNACQSNQTTELIDEILYCTVCGSDEVTVATSGKYRNYVVGRVIKVEAVAGKKDLKKVLIDITGAMDESDALQVVTNAKHIDANIKVVVALENAVVPAGANVEEDTNAVLVKKSSVGGVRSDGMLCDSFMLGWSGGAKGVLQVMQEDCIIGGSPPSSRPRPA